jgi:hypothetical protein
MTADRLSPVSARDVINARERALVATVEGVAVPAMPGPFVVLLSEVGPPCLAGWPRVLDFLRDVSGVELHDDTVARVDEVIATGGVPALTLIDGWVNVRTLGVLPLTAGGDA